MTLQAHAKINWTLEVLGKRPDGYHDLRSIVLPISLHDDVRLEEADVVDVSGLPYGEDDLACRAARVLRERTGCTRGARISVVKRIPAGGGLGGGSADAAATLRGLNGLWGLGLGEEDLVAIAADVGSDVPALVLGGPVLMEGRGERVSRWTGGVPAAADIVVLVPDIFASTPHVFAEFREEDRGRGRNDLQPAALRLYPGIADALRRLEEQGLSDVAMSGSGSAVYGVKGRNPAVNPDCT